MTKKMPKESTDPITRIEDERVLAYLRGSSQIVNVYYIFIVMILLIPIYIFIDSGLYPILHIFLFLLLSGVLFCLKPIIVYFLLQLINIDTIKFQRDEMILREELRNNKENLDSILLRKHYIQMHKYYRQSLNQSKRIFSVGILLTTFGLISIPILIVFTHENSYIPLILQTVLVSFVLVIFQLMYSKSSKLNDSYYHGLLEIYKN